MKHKTIKVGRNDPCPCGSGLKYKKCCQGKPLQKTDNIEQVYARKYGIRLKKTSDIEKIRRAGRLAIETLDRVEAMIRPGIATNEIDTLVHQFTVQTTPGRRP